MEAYKINSQSLEDTQVGYILQKNASDNYTLEKYILVKKSLVMVAISLVMVATSLVRVVTSCSQGAGNVVEVQGSSLGDYRYVWNPASGYHSPSFDFDTVNTN